MTDTERIVITLMPAAASKLRDMSARLGLRPTEVVRRGLSLMRLWIECEDTGSKLMIRRPNGDLEGVLLCD